MAQYMDKKLAFEIVKGVLNLLQSEDKVKSLLPKISNNAPIIYEGFMSNLSDLYKFANNEYKDKIVNVVLDNIALDNLIEVKEVDLQEEPKVDWLQELQNKLDSLSKEDFEKVMTKYSRYGGEGNVDYNKLNTMLDESLSKETKESWNKRLGEEPVSEDLDKEMDNYLASVFNKDMDGGNPRFTTWFKALQKTAIHFANWQKENLWKPADGDDLPIFDREVIVLIKYNAQRNIHDEEYPTYRVGFGHRPNPDGWDGKNIDTNEVTHYTPKLYGKGGWNAPDIVYWLDCLIPKEIEL